MRTRFLVWLAGVLVMLAVCAGVVLPKLQVETDILALLPADRQDAAADRAVEAFSQTLARRIVFLVGAPDDARARAAAQRFATALREPGAFVRVDLDVSAHLVEQVELYRRHRQYLLSDQQFALLRDGRSDALRQDALRAAFTPAGLMRPLSLSEDPLGLAAGYLMQQLPAMGAAELDGTVLRVSDAQRTYVLVVAETDGSPFASALQERAMPAIRQAVASARAGDEAVLILSSGTLQHADAATRRAKAEISLFGGIETVAVLLLLWSVLGALRPLALGTLAFGLAAAAGVTLSYFLFGRLHLLALVFGSSLIGSVVDYSIHFFADRFRQPSGWRPVDAVHHVGGAILLGLTTTLLGYLALVWVPFPGLQQIAAFCIVGLIVGCATVLCGYPMLMRAEAAPPPERGPRVAAAIGRFMDRWQWSPVRIAVTVVLLGAALLGLLRVQIQDDVRALQSSPPHLVEMERQVNELLRTGVESRFFLVRAPSEQGVLEIEERLRAELDDLVAQGRLNSYVALTRGLPSLQHQQATRELLDRQVFQPQGMLGSVMAQFGFPAEVIERRAQEFTQAPVPLTPAAWLASPASEAYRHLWLGEIDGRYATVVTLGGIKDIAALEQAAARVEGVRFIDRLGAVTEVLRSHRSALGWLLAAVYAAAGVVLALRFGWRDVPRLLVPSMAATAVTLGLFGWLGVPVNLFTLLALWLVLGLGIDYGIFLRHGRTVQNTAILSVTLSALTTLIAFGLLAFSATPFIRSIGLTLLFSITLSWLFVMFSCLTIKGAAPAPSQG